MANNLKMANDGVNAEANALAAELNNGYLRIYDSTGTGQPATADTAVTTQVLLAELRFGATAFGAAVAGVITANAITGTSNAAATGTATWFRCLKSDGTTPVLDGSVGTSGADLNLNSTAIQIHAEVDVTSFVHTVTKKMGIQVPPDSSGQVVETKDVSLGASNVERQVTLDPAVVDKLDKLLKLEAMQTVLLMRLADWAWHKDQQQDFDEVAEEATDLLEEI